VLLARPAKGAWQGRAGWFRAYLIFRVAAHDIPPVIK